MVAREGEGREQGGREALGSPGLVWVLGLGTSFGVYRMLLVCILGRKYSFFL